MRVSQRIRLRPAAAILCVALAGVLITFVIKAVGGGGVIHHYDGQGPLGSTGDPSNISGFTFDKSSGSGPWTLGYLVCLVQGNDPAIIESISPTKLSGNGYRYIGAQVREFDPTAGGRGLIEANGYPPSVPQTLHPAIGYAVAAPCSSAQEHRYTELDLGFGRASGSDGGGWTGINVGYRVGRQQYVVSLGYRIYVCGPAVPDAEIRQSCIAGEQLTPPPTPAGH